MRAAILRQISENGLDPKVAHVSVDGKLRPKDSPQPLDEELETKKDDSSKEPEKDLKENPSEEISSDVVTEDLQQKDAKKKGGLFKKKQIAQ